MSLITGTRIARRLWRAEEGQDLIEYALLVGLVALVAVAAVSSLGAAVKDVLWATISSAMP